MSKRIIITGASSGIGLASAKLFASQGHQLVVAARRTSALKALADQYPSQVKYIACDVCKVNEVQKMIDLCLRAFGGIDVLINNAGMGIFDPLSEASLDDWHHMFDVNVKGLLSCTHLALPHLRQSKGQIINLGSVASHNVFPNSGVYCATKHAVIAISESLRIELGKEIRVSTISPGAVNTEFIDHTRNENLLKDFRPSFAAGMTSETIAEHIAHAVNAPSNVSVSEIIIRPFNG